MFRKFAGSLAATAVCLFWAGAASAGTMTGSAHDFSAETWNSNTGEICVVCHTPHDSLASDPGPLWNRDAYTLPTGANAFTMYDDANLGGSVDSVPTGTSVLCLSCHDGTVAIDSFGGQSGSVTMGDINAGAVVDNDLTDDHPISITYNNGGTILGSEMRATDYSITFGNSDSGTTADLIESGKVQCASCHDVHNTQATNTDQYLLRVDNDGSGLCLACHAK